jgi:hypothetical protein
MTLSLSETVLIICGAGILLLIAGRCLFLVLFSLHLDVTEQPTFPNVEIQNIPIAKVEYQTKYHENEENKENNNHDKKELYNIHVAIMV